jgi:hypothetical protein
LVVLVQNNLILRRITIDKNITQSTFCKFFQPIFCEKFLGVIRSLKLDRYIKKLQTIQFILILIYGQIQQQKSLPVLVNNFNNQDFCKAIKLESISVSQLSRRLNHLSPQVLHTLFQEMVLLLHSKIGVGAAVKQIGPLHIIDSSTITLSLTKYPWAKYRKSKSGVKLHLQLKFWDGNLYPDAATLTCAKIADSKKLDKLVVEDSDIMNVFDRGYIDYKRFDDYCKHGIRFTSRLKDSAIVTVISENPVTPNGVVRRDCIVRLGDGKTKMQHNLRLIEVFDTQGNLLSIITNDLKAPAEEIGQIYRYRWQIELFFKWIKQHFSVKHFYATSPNAVENQIYIALIAYCLLLFLKMESKCPKSLLEMTRVLIECLYESYDEFVQKICFKPPRTSNGRLKVNYEKEYSIFERQVFQTTNWCNVIDSLSNQLMYL